MHFCPTAAFALVIAPDNVQPSRDRLTTTAFAGQAADFKGHISHSTVEKQRRDRINSLIDEVRDWLVSARLVGVVGGPA